LAVIRTGSQLAACGTFKKAFAKLFHTKVAEYRDHIPFRIVRSSQENPFRLRREIPVVPPGPRRASRFDPNRTKEYAPHGQGPAVPRRPSLLWPISPLCVHKVVPDALAYP